MVEATPLNNELADIKIALRALDTEQAKVGKKAALARLDYERAKSIAMLEIKTDPDWSKATVPMQQAEADRRCEKERVAARCMESDEKATMRSIDLQKALLQATQSQCGLLKAEAEMDRYTA